VNENHKREPAVAGAPPVASETTLPALDDDDRFQDEERARSAEKEAAAARADEARDEADEQHSPATDVDDDDPQSVAEETPRDGWQRLFGNVRAAEFEAQQNNPPLVGVVFPEGSVGEFSANDLRLMVGDTVVVENERDLNLGKVVYLGENKEGQQLRRVLRKVAAEDLMLIRRNAKREEEAFALCQKLVEEQKLQMKLMRVSYLHGGNKAIFFFSAEGRVDFRQLVRDLAKQLHVRIEMRQIGVRDEAKMLGGVGVCGQPLCCARYLRKFVPVSIKMAKNQGLALNPQKVSGLCSRLMCCLVYEDDVYRDLRKNCPRTGKPIMTSKGPGRVLDIDVLRGRVRVELEDRVEAFNIEELKQSMDSQPAQPSNTADTDEATEEGKESLTELETSRMNATVEHVAPGAPKAARPTAAEGAAPEEEGGDEPVAGIGAEAPFRRRRRRNRRRRRHGGGDEAQASAGSDPSRGPQPGSSPSPGEGHPVPGPFTSFPTRGRKS
jgi:cell fate regulator YaaT (PSP1 superfamily)